MKTKSIALDIDGVLANFGWTWNVMANEVLGTKIPVDLEHNSWDFGGLGLTPDQIRQVWQKFDHTELAWRSVPPYEENVSAMRRYLCREQRALVYFVTSRQDTIGDPALTQSRDWLFDQGFHPKDFTVIVVKHSYYKPQIYRSIGIGASLDDYVPNVIGANHIDNHKARALSRPWNKRAIEDFGVKSVSSVAGF